MANFLLIVDPDATRRVSAAHAARARVAFLPRLQAGLSLASRYALAWAAAPHAPLAEAVSSDGIGGDAVLFGEPHDASGVTYTAEMLRHRRQANWSAAEALNGLYCALFIHPEKGVRVEGDALGIFPLYYWQSGEVVLVATSPVLFRCHPAFRSTMDLHGVAGLLLTSGLVGGRTLWQGVRRLAPDHLLFCAPQRSANEVAPRALESAKPLHSVDEAVDAAAALHDSFLRTALKTSRLPGLQLSGGLDSRLLAGFTTQLGHRPTSLTFGRRQDLDARCATLVARELELRQALCDVSPADYAGYASSSLEWEQLSGGLYALPMGWNIAQTPPAEAMDRMVCGLTLDAVIGGPKNVARAGGTLSFEQLRVGRLGFSRSALQSLIANADLARACDDVRAELVTFYLNAGATDYLREWRTNLAHRHRFAVGACAWRYGLFAWPVMPAIDRSLIQLAASLPHDLIKDRQIQTRMLISRFPRLARLDLDRNYLDTPPLVGAPRTVFYNVRRRVVKLTRRARGWLGEDPRFYVRTMDFNGRGWRVIRAQADEARDAAHSLFHRAALTQLVPPAHVKVPTVGDPIIHSTPLKNTVGLMLWMRQPA